MRNLGIGIFSALFCASLVVACSASGNDPVGTGGETGTGATDSGAAADTSVTYTYDAGPDNVVDSGSGTKTPIDSGSTAPPIDSGSTTTTTSNDCDLSGAGLISAIPALESGGDGPCGTDDACSSGDCCVNFAALFAGGGLPPEFSAIFSSGSAPVCTPE